MIVDDFRHANHYACLGSLFRTASDFLSRGDLQDLPEGTLPIQGNRVLAIIAAYKPIPLDNKILLEGHFRYADIQYVVSGCEQLAWLPANRVSDRSSYDPDKDVWTALVKKEEASFVRLTTNEFAILFPWDAHAPQLEDRSVGHVKKIVMKVAVGEGKP